MPLLEIRSDDFNRADGGLGSNWTTMTGANTPRILSNEAAPQASPTYVSPARYSGYVGLPADQWAEVVIGSQLDSNSDEGSGPACRMASGSLNMYFAQCGSGEVRLYKHSGGFTQLGSTVGGVSTGDVIRLECVGTSITVKKNGTTIIGPITDSSVTSGDAGIWLSDGATQRTTLNSWRAGVFKVEWLNNNSLVSNDFSGAGGNHVLSPPANLAAGDLWACSITADVDTAAGEITTPSGWNHHYNVRNNTSEWPAGHLFWKVAGASESNVTFVCASGAYQVTGLSARIAGANATTPFGTPVSVSYNNQSAPLTSYDPGQITVANNGAAVMQHLWGQKYGNTTSNPTMSSELTTVYTVGTTYCRGGLAYGSRDAGAFNPADLAFDNGGWTRISILMVEVNPAGGPIEESITETAAASFSTTGVGSLEESMSSSAAASFTTDGTVEGSSVSSVRADRVRGYARGLGRGM